MRTPQLRLERIDTTPEHLRAFAHAHPLEHREQTVEHVEGTTWLHRQELKRECYTLVTPDIGEWVFDVTSIKQVLSRNLPPFEMVRAHLTQEWVDYIYRTGNCEEDHLARLTAADLDRPGIMVFFGPGRCPQIDGSHRLVGSWRAGRRTFDLALISVEDAGVFMCRPGEEDRLFEVARALEIKLGNLVEPEGEKVGETEVQRSSTIDTQAFIRQAREEFK